ncbi:hypothetical protein ABID56_000437 [Alkalibacillus flavidus]|uniref:Uncharacterized protein n=1 Tax=Alkalibacillus flavidus TaxID=546021 RepID=A0ABV2KS03_9BACI
MTLDNQNHEDKSTIDVMELPPRHTVHTTKRTRKGSEENLEDSTVITNKNDDTEPSLFYYKLSIHIVLVLFIILSLGIPIYYYFMLNP